MTLEIAPPPLGCPLMGQAVIGNVRAQNVLPLVEVPLPQLSYDWASHSRWYGRPQGRLVPALLVMEYLGDAGQRESHPARSIT
jgi:hypothetical protein